MKYKVRESAKKKFVVWSVYMGWVSMLISLLLVLVVAVTIWTIPSRVDVNKEQSAYARAEFFARSFLVAWLSGSNKSEATVDAMKRMSSAPGDLSKINASPMKVTNINTVDVLWTDTDSPSVVEWAFTMGATLAPPGGKVGRSFFRLTILEKDKSYQVIVLPRPVNVGVDAIKVDTVYNGSVDTTSELGTLLGNFATAYLVPSQSGRMGGYVTENFKDAPISSVPYVSVSIPKDGINFAGKDPSTAKAGDKIDVLVTVRAAVTGETFNIVQLPLRVQMANNGGWLVDGITEPVNFGAIAPR